MHKTIHLEPYGTLVRWLKACRRSRGLNMRELAAKLGVPHSWVGKIEQCERRLDIAEYAKLCKALDVNPHDGLDLLLSFSKESSVAARTRRRNVTKRRVKSHS